MTDIKTTATGRYYIHTFGCQMNVHDSEHLAGVLETLGYQAAECEEEADVIFLNTCSVREKADQKLFTKLGRVRLLKRSNPDLIVGVSGCIAQREGERLFDRAPHTDIVLGTRAISRLPVLLQEFKQKRESGGGGVSFVELEGNLSDSAIFVRGSKAVAYVTIMEGCDNFCSYCIVPHVRGREISRPAGNILEEVRRLAENGYVEIQLLGQNVNSYNDENSGMDFAGLLDNVARISGIDRIRFITSHPKDFTEGVAEVMARHDNICNAIHLPPQSGSDSILKAMNRKYTRMDYLNKVKVLKKHLKNVSVSGDFICGFPGENEADFKLSLDLLAEVRFSNLFTFVYSPRPGTKAAELDDDVAREVKVERLQRMQQLQERIQRENHGKMVGMTQPVLIEGESAHGGGQLCGRTEGNLVVNLTASKDLIGRIIPVEIIEAGSHSLSGRLMGPS
ncbi:MAG TPA: tRNA (N6-isopentenyl adenosine(37)-C2)-methylthiotransferase MiaB [Acidobacteriota bacterium]|nr:tRNA (N6-isopentenyl adenosine(37)-C2)-methylthiotransferase MiaB [Acidobacteriota bacterium]